MGCDGGTIPKRHELVRTAKRPEQKDKDMDRKAKWSTCTITQQALSTPVVTCELGKLYSKESVLEFLLDRSICDTALHLRNLKDLKTLKLAPNPGFDKKASGTANEYYDTQTSKFVCPIVGVEMNGKYKFYALWSCGCVISERAFKEAESKTCHNCGMAFEKEDIIILNAEGDEFAKMEENMKQRREKLKKLKKEEKDKKIAEKRKVEEDTALTNGFAVPKVPSELNGSNSKKSKLAGTDSKKERKKKPKLQNRESSTSKDSNKKNPKKAASKVEEDKIDVTQSKVYKSLFASSENKNDKDHQAHWITYNPYHL